MERIRLTGLFLFITAIFLGLAAAATKTTHIDFSTPNPLAAQDSPVDKTPTGPESANAESPNTSESPNSPLNDSLEETRSKPQFTSVPIIYPLTGVGMLGLALWFVPAAELPKKAAPPRKRRRRRSTTRPRRALSRRT